MKISEVTESFDSYSGKNIKCIKSTNNQFITIEKIGDREIIFTAVEESSDVWGVDFMERSEKVGQTYDVTGSGNQMQVFGFVIESLKLFIQKYSPGQIEFTSSKNDNNRTRVYNAIAKKVHIPGYSLDVVSNRGYDLFRMTRNST